MLGGAGLALAARGRCVLCHPFAATYLQSRRLRLQDHLRGYTCDEPVPPFRRLVCSRAPRQERPRRATAERRQQERNPDYVDEVKAAADRALAFYAQHGFKAPPPDTDGSDSRAAALMSAGCGAG